MVPAGVSAAPGLGISSLAGEFSARIGIGAVLREVRESGVVLLPSAPASVAVARRRITADLAAAGVFETAIGDAALVLSELLSNSIVHARPLHGRRLQADPSARGAAIAVLARRPRAGHRRPPVGPMGGAGRRAGHHGLGGRAGRLPATGRPRGLLAVTGGSGGRPGRCLRPLPGAARWPAA